MHFYPWDARMGFQYRSITEDKRWIHIRDDYYQYLREAGYRKYHGNEHEGYFKLIAKQIERHKMVFGTYLDNVRNIPDFKIKIWENYRFSNPSHYFTDILGYSSGGAKGVVFKHEVNWFKYSALPDVDFYETFGLDFGGGGISEKRIIYPETYINDENDGTSTTVLVKLYINKNSMSCYVKLKLFKAFIDSNDLVKICKKETFETDDNNDQHIIKKRNILADNARPDKIRELLNAGLNCIGAKSKEGGSSRITTGIDIMKKYKIYIHEDDQEALIDFNNYRWEISKTSGELTGNPEKKFENVVDAIRYALVNFDLYNW